MDMERPKKCDICGCTQDKYYYRWSKTKENFGVIMCMKHYQQMRLYGKITDDRISTKYMERTCSHCGSKENVIYDKKTEKMLCRIHYQQLNRLGGIQERTKQTPNDYEINREEQIAIVSTYDAKHELTGKFIIDLEDLDKIMEHKWYLTTGNYPTTSSNNLHVSLHLFLKGEKGKIVDHIDRNPLNNRKSNLRVVDKKINALNIEVRKNNTSGVTGVSFNKLQNKWRAYINIDGKRVELGHYDEMEDAIVIRLKEEYKILGYTSPQTEKMREYKIGDYYNE